MQKLLGRSAALRGRSLQLGLRKIPRMALNRQTRALRWKFQVYHGKSWREA